MQRLTLREFLQNPNASAGEWKAAIWRNQHPAQCGRFLLIEDDLEEAGLGFTVSVHAAALLIAVQQRRVLLEIPVNDSWRLPFWDKPGSWHYKRRKVLAARPRWCDRPPWTLQCLYEPPTHCAAPSNAAQAAATQYWARNLGPVHVKFRSPRYMQQQVVRMKLSLLAPNIRLMRAVSTTAQGAALRFLLRPREWVLRVSKCVMAWAQLGNRFVTVHARVSPEKEAETQRRNKLSMPPVRYYAELAGALASRAGDGKVFVQTSNPLALRELSRLLSTHEHELHVTATNNTRSEHDTWGGWLRGREMEDAAVAAVNLHIASRAPIFVSPTLSAWTGLVQRVSGARPKDVLRVCCFQQKWSPTSCARSNLLVSAPSTLSLAHLRASVDGLPHCRLWMSPAELGRVGTKRQRKAPHDGLP